MAEQPKQRRLPLSAQHWLRRRQPRRWRTGCMYCDMGYERHADGHGFHHTSKDGCDRLTCTKPVQH